MPDPNPPPQLHAAIRQWQINLLIAIVAFATFMAAISLYTANDANRTARGASAGAAVIGQQAAPGDWQEIHDIACQNGAINCGPDPATSTTGGTPSTATSTTSSTTTSTVPPTSSSTSPTTSQPSTTTTSTSTTSSTAPSTTSTTSTVPPTQTGWPNASNTGVPAGTALTTYTGSCMNVPAGTVIDAKTINCGMMTLGSNVTIRRSKINGNAFSVVRPATLPGGGQASGHTIIDTEITCNGAEGAYAINGGNSGVYQRLNIHDCENGIEPGSNVSFTDSYIHTFRASGAPHYDGVSIDGGQSNVVIRHNNVVLNANQTGALMTDNYFGSLANIDIINNRFIGGGYTVYVDGRFNSQRIEIELRDNRVDGGYWGYSLTEGSNVQITQSGNVDDSSGQPITL